MTSIAVDAMVAIRSPSGHVSLVTAVAVRG